MRKFSPVLFIFFFSFLCYHSNAQSCFNTGINGLTINVPCSTPCISLSLKINDLKSSSEYDIQQIPFAPPRSFTSGGEDPSNYIDDRFTGAYSSFPMCFYDSLFTQFVLGSNGVLSFDVSNANCGNAWKLEQGNGVAQPLPYLGAQVCGNSTGPKYSRYSVFSPYHDINPAVAGRRISWAAYNFAPCRVFFVNFNEVALFGDNTQKNTSQIVYYETTGIVEIHIKEKRLDMDASVWNGNLAILGLQKDDTKAHPVPGKNATIWEEYNTAYRFTPSGPTTRYIKSELYSLAGALLQTTTQSVPSATPGQRDVTFGTQLCPTAVTKYVIKTYYSICSPTSTPIVFTDTITVNGNAPLTATTTTTNPSCEGANNGTVTITPAPTNVGTTDYSIDNGVTWQSSATFTGLAAGTYSFIYRNANGCVSPPFTATINPGTPLSSTIAVTNAKCNATATGTAIVTVSNSGNFQYSLDNVSFQPSNQFSNLAAGTYTAYYVEASGCTGSKSFIITEPAALQLAATAQAVKCKGQPNGIITITSSGGTPAYQYSIDGTNYQSSGTFNVAAGVYTVYAKDLNNCTVNQQVTVTEPSALDATSAVTNASCDGGADGTITVSANGGTPPYQYTLNGSFQASNVFYVGQGTYTITVKDANNCVFDVSGITVAITNNLSITPIADPASICEGSSVQLQSQTNGTQFSWSPSTGLSAANISNPVASPVTTTTYYLTVTKGSCTGYDTVVVSVMPAPVPDAGPDGNICYGQSFIIQGSGGQSYEWSGASGFSSTSPSSSVNPTQTTTYNLHVIDANGCHSLQPDMVTVNVTPPIVVVATPDTVVAKGDQFQLYANSAATDYSWSPSTGLSDPNIPNPIATIDNDIVYIVTATTSAGCKGEATVRITVFEGPEIYVPGGFTPNNDGKNDIFRPFPVGIKKLNYFRIFNRWGELIYSTSSFYQGWDGTIRGLKQGTGTFIYMVEGVTKTDKIIRKRGSFVLIR
jgi:gliding motility-associated-like protein